MKKRLLSWLLVLAMILTGVPMATAAGSGFVSPDAEAPSYEGGPLELPVDTGVEAQSGMLDPSTVEAGSDTLENEPKIVHDASGRFSLTEAGQTKKNCRGYGCGELHRRDEGAVLAGCRLLHRRYRRADG